MSRLADFIVAEAEYREAHPAQRRGQTAFNALAVFDPDIADEVYSSGLDPYHDDGNLPAFWVYVMERLDAGS